jgi:hypothetical protein
MGSIKSRLYVTLDARNKSGTYHWALALAPNTKTQTGYTPVNATRYHARNVIQEGNEIWEHERKEMSQGPNRTLIAIYIADIPRADVIKIAEILDNVPVVQNNPIWTCRSWVKDAIVAVSKQGAVTIDVEDVERTALWYVQKKISEGRFTAERYSWGTSEIPTWNWQKKKEIQS